MNARDQGGDPTATTPDAGAAAGHNGRTPGPDGPGAARPSPAALGAELAHRRLARWGIRAFAVLGAAVGAVMVVQFAYYRFTRSMTDDAFVESHIVHLAVQEAGLHTRVLVEEHDEVKAGQLLAEVDPIPVRREVEEATATRKVAEGSMRLAEASLHRLEQERPRRVAVAEKEFASAEAAVEEEQALLKITVQDVEDAVKEARADLAAVEAEVTNAREEYERFSRLFAEQSTPERRLQDITRAFRAAQARAEAARAKVGRAEANREQVQVVRATLNQKLQARDKAEEGLRLARLGELEIEVQRQQVRLRREQVEEAARTEATVMTRLQNTRVVAPFDAVVARRYRNPGDHAPLGSPVLSIYDPELVYVTAYLEEDRLEGVAPGNRVRIWVEAFPEVLSGRVVWIG